MTKVHLAKGEPIDKALRKFKTRVRRDGIIDEIRKREFYEKPSQRRRKKMAKARRKELRRLSEE
ncbi:MAG: 30S ribosomal protein S21 [Candidatus Margulisiibacteriota bacterium]|nr:30S ribosomal protein S21 [Candidatus Margulisiibacteriota bacterium]